MRCDLRGPVGRLEALLDEPAGPVRAAAVFGHPHPEYGGTMHNKVTFRAAKSLQGIRCAVLRFNFRGTGRSEGTHDRGIGEVDDFRAGVDFMAERFPAVPLWTGGFSFGAWVALTLGADDPRVSLLLAIAPPVSGRQIGGLQQSPKPKFFVHGERDEVCPLSAMRQVYGRLSEPKELVVIDGANHLFDGKVGEVGDAIEDLLADYPDGD